MLAVDHVLAKAREEVGAVDVNNKQKSTRVGGYPPEKCAEKVVTIEDMCTDVVHLQEPYSCPKKETKVSCRPGILQVPRVCHRVGVRWVEKSCNLIDYELKCNKRLVDLPGKCTKEWMIQQPYPCALTSTEEECSVQRIEVPDQCSRTTLKPLSFECVKETLETYCEGQMDFIGLPQGNFHRQSRDRETQKKLPPKVIRKLAEPRTPGDDDISEFSGTHGEPSLCKKASRRHVPYSCSRPGMKQQCKVVKQKRAYQCIKEEQEVSEFDCSYTEMKLNCSGVELLAAGRGRSEITSSALVSAGLASAVEAGENSREAGTLPPSGQTQSSTKEESFLLQNVVATDRHNQRRRLRKTTRAADPLQHIPPGCVEEEVRVQKTCKGTTLKKAERQCESDEDEEVCETIRDDTPGICYTVEEFDEVYSCPPEPELRQLVPANCKTRSVKRKEICTKTLPFTEDFTCEAQVPVTTCSPVTKIDATTCYRTAQKTMEYSCLKPTEVEECMPVPVYRAGKCFEQEEYKQAYECTETKVRQKCEQLEKEVASHCFKGVKQKITYPCRKATTERVCSGRETEERLGRQAGADHSSPPPNEKHGAPHTSVHAQQVTDSQLTDRRARSSPISSSDAAAQQAALAALRLAHAAAAGLPSPPERPPESDVQASSSVVIKDEHPAEGTRHINVTSKARRLLPAFKPWGLKSKNDPPYSSVTVHLPVPPPPPGGVYLGPRAYAINELNRQAALGFADVAGEYVEDVRLPPAHIVEFNDTGNQHRKYFLKNPSTILPPVPPQPLPGDAFYSLSSREKENSHDGVLFEQPVRGGYNGSPQVGAEGFPIPLEPLVPGSPVPSLLTDVSAASPTSISNLPAPVRPPLAQPRAAPIPELHDGHMWHHAQPASHGHEGGSTPSQFESVPELPQQAHHFQNSIPDFQYGGLNQGGPQIVDGAGMTDEFSALEAALVELPGQNPAAPEAAYHHHPHANSSAVPMGSTVPHLSTRGAVPPFNSGNAWYERSGVSARPSKHDVQPKIVVGGPAPNAAVVPNYEVMPPLHRIQQLTEEVHNLVQLQRTQRGFLTDQQRQLLEEIIRELELLAGSGAFSWKQPNQHQSVTIPAATETLLQGEVTVAHPKEEMGEENIDSVQPNRSQSPFEASKSGATAPTTDVQSDKLRELLESLLAELRSEQTSLTTEINQASADGDLHESLTQELKFIKEDIGIVEDGLSRLDSGELSKEEMQSLWQFLLGDDVPHTADAETDATVEKKGKETSYVYETQRQHHSIASEAMTITPNPDYGRSVPQGARTHAFIPTSPEDVAGSMALAAAAAVLHNAMAVSFTAPVPVVHHPPQPPIASPVSAREALIAAVLDGAFEIKAHILKAMHTLQHLIDTTDMPVDREREARYLLEGLKRDLGKMHNIVDRASTGELSTADLQYISVQLEAVRQKAEGSAAMQERGASAPLSSLPSTTGSADLPPTGESLGRPGEEYSSDPSGPDGTGDPGNAVGTIPLVPHAGMAVFEPDVSGSSPKKNRDSTTPQARTNVYITINIDETGNVTSERRQGRRLSKGMLPCE
ncbi:hypothetical protein BESB_012140 [Besnoitia besnoiti]|uniref:Toxoplasma gondii family D protein n=1 Tax=Besnoitia besnoiti TaxID=94643 RepID=A0A2A9MB34_BESBE|nr:hypothetical protein BESB_012140 [Besnoitia besnoiti]PFH32602.1 hypothetical protein BESB_012140 [Besnoitia besnoiti]